jgi:fatty acid desaturase
MFRAVRRTSDVRVLVFLASHYALSSSVWAAAPFAPRFAVPLAVLLSVCSWLCAIIAHNTVHCPVFESRRANGVFQVFLSCAYGFPVSEYLPGHNLSHHRHLQKDADSMRTTKAPFVRLNVLNLCYFAPRIALDVFRQNRLYIAAVAKRTPKWHRQLLCEGVACWGTKAVLLALDWRRALAFVVIPQLFAVYGIITVNLFQHDGCDEDHPLNHSRNFVGKIFNWFTFNNGFHGVHHDQPGLHWSLLPAVHRERYHGRVAPELEQRSFLLYFFRNYVGSARRAHFDGRPMTAITVRRDETWIPRHMEAHERGDAA